MSSEWVNANRYTAKQKSMDNSLDRYSDNKQKLECCEHCPHADCRKEVGGACLTLITYAEFTEFMRIMTEMHKTVKEFAMICHEIGFTTESDKIRKYPSKTSQKQIKEFLKKQKERRHGNDF